MTGTGTRSELTGRSTQGESCEVAILGGGIAGLVAAWQLIDRDVVLLESADRIGGRVKSVRRGDYWANLGAQYLAGTGTLAEMVDELGIPRGSLIGSRTALGLKGKVVASDRPAEFVLRSPLSLRGRADFARYGLRIRRMYKQLTSNPDPNAARELRDQLDNSSAEIFTAGLKDRDVQAMSRAFVESWVGAEAPEVSAWQLLLNVGSALQTASKTPNFSLPVGGNQVITDTLATTLGDRIRLSASVASVSWDDDGVDVLYDDAHGNRRQLRANQCVVALPAHAALNVLTALPEQHRAALEAVRYGQFLVAALFTGEKDVQVWDDLYSITVPGRSFQIIFNHAAALRRGGPRRPGGALVAYAGGDSARAIADLSESEIAKLFVRDLSEVLPGSGRLVEDIIIQRWPQAIPFWSPRDRPLIRHLRAPLGPLHFAGDYLGLPSMAAAAKSGEVAGRAALGALATFAEIRTNR